MLDFRTPHDAPQGANGTISASPNGHSNGYGNPETDFKPKLIDSLEAQHGALRHILRAGDTNKAATLRRNVDPGQFQDPDARAIAEMLWQQYEASAPIDSISIGAALAANGQTSVFNALFDLMLTPEHEPDFRDCIHTVLNWKKAVAASPSYETFTFKDMAALPRPQWLIRSLLVEKTTSVISADSGHFKSFIALECALCVATGTPFHGREVRQGTAVYVAAEGFYTAYERAAAWAQERGCDLPENFHLLKVPINVSEAATVQRFAECIKEFAPVLVVLDTLSQCAVGLNENANNEMADFMRGMAALADSIGAHVQTVHHNSKATGTFRGAGAIKANVDTHITLDRPDAEQNIVFVRCEKQRGKPFDAFALAGAEVELPFTDEFGDPVTSLVFEVCGETVTAKHPNAKKADKTGAALMTAFDIVASEAAALGVEGVKIGFWKEKAEESDPPICSDSAFWRHRKALENAGAIEECGNHGGSVLYRRKPDVLSQLSQLSSDSTDSKPKPAIGKVLSQLSSPFRDDSTDSTPTIGPKDTESEPLFELEPTPKTSKAKTRKAASEPYKATSAREKVTI